MGPLLRDKTAPRRLASEFDWALTCTVPSPAPETAEAMRSHAADEVTVQVQADAVPLMATENTDSKNPKCVEELAKLGAHTRPAWSTVRTCCPNVGLQVELCRIKWPDLAAPKLSVTAY